MTCMDRYEHRQYWVLVFVFFVNVNTNHFVDSIVVILDPSMLSKSRWWHREPCIVLDTACVAWTWLHKPLRQCPKIYRARDGAWIKRVLLLLPGPVKITTNKSLNTSSQKNKKLVAYHSTFTFFFWIWLYQVRGNHSQTTYICSTFSFSDRSEIQKCPTTDFPTLMGMVTVM